MSRRRVLEAMAGTVAAVAASTLVRQPAAHAAPAGPTGGGLSLTPLGTAGGPPPVPGRFGISTAMVVNGRTYVIDCGRGAVSQYVRAGLSMPSLSGLFLTHLHADHTVDYFSFPLLSGGVAGARGFQKPITVFGPGSGGSAQGSPPAGQEFVLPDHLPGTVAMTRSMNEAFAQSTDFFLTEHAGIDPASMVDVHDIEPPAAVGSSPTRSAPEMQAFDVMENDDFKLSAILVPHGAVYPAYAYRFDTDHGSVVFSGDTARTPNIPTLAHGADVLVHEAADIDILMQAGYPQATIDHIKATHTDVKDLGQVAKEADVETLVATHLVPSDTTVVSDAEWRRLLWQSAERAGFCGNTILATELQNIPVDASARHGR